MDRVKISLRHVHDLRASGTTFLMPSVRELIQMISDNDDLDRDPTARASGLDRASSASVLPLGDVVRPTPVASAVPAPPEPPPTRPAQNFDEPSQSSSSSECILIEATCNCPACVEKRGPEEVLASQASQLGLAGARGQAWRPSFD